jgi:hypothetical protein
MEKRPRIKYLVLSVVVLISGCANNGNAPVAVAPAAPVETPLAKPVEPVLSPREQYRLLCSQCEDALSEHRYSDVEEMSKKRTALSMQLKDDSARAESLLCLVLVYDIEEKKVAQESIFSELHALAKTSKLTPDQLYRINGMFDRNQRKLHPDAFRNSEQAVIVPVVQKRAVQSQVSKGDLALSAMLADPAPKPGPFDTYTFAGQELELSVRRADTLNEKLQLYDEARSDVQRTSGDEQIKYKSQAMDCLRGVHEGADKCYSSAQIYLKKADWPVALYLAEAAYKGYHATVGKSDPQLKASYGLYYAVKNAQDSEMRMKASQFR